MKTVTIDRATIENALDQIMIDLDNVRPAYSGRAMYGATCLGIEFEGHGQIAQFLVEFTALCANDVALLDEEPDVYEVTEPARHLARTMRIDQLGHNLIAYFPGTQIAGE